MTTPPQSGGLYDQGFFESQAPASGRSAQVIVPMIADLIRPSSVADVGCGIGTWLSAFRQAGVDDILGIDGAYVDQSLLQIPRENFQPWDLRQPVRLDRQFDLVLSLEVAEHLPAATTDVFLDSVTSLGPVVLFSAAVPGQGGTGHINEQWPTHWLARFSERGYECFDTIRPVIWDDDRIEYWYRQNTLLFVSREHLEKHEGLERELALESLGGRSLVHPRLFEAMTRSLRAGRPRPDRFSARIRHALPPRARARLREWQQKLKP